MISSDKTNEESNKTRNLFCEYKPFAPVDKNKKTIMDKEIGSLRSNFKRAKTFFKKSSFLDKDLGTVRSHLIKAKSFLGNVLYYLKSFFTKKKAKEIVAIFSYQRTMKKKRPKAKANAKPSTLKEVGDGLRH